MKKTIFLVLSVFLGVVTTVYSQQCGTAFTDPAGPSANYVNDSDYTITICPTNPGEVVTVTFTQFDIEADWDALYVFNGNSSTSTQIPSTNPAANVPGGLAGGFWGTALPGPFTSTSPDGCLTFRFRSDNSVTRGGWVADVSCGPPSSCSSPESLTVTAATHSSVLLNRTQPVNTDSSIATAWQILALPCGSPTPTQAATGFVFANANPFVLTGLYPLTCYAIYVRPVCDDPTPWCGFPVVTTPPAPPECGGQYLDNGGTSNYTNNADVTTTICPSNPSEVVSVVFNSFDTETNWDALYVFDGSSITSPQIQSQNPAGNVIGGMPGGFWGDAIPGPFTSSSPDGCLTFRFRSDGSVTNPGWVANVYCVPNANDRIVLIAFVDQNSNGIRDTGEPTFSNGSFIYQQNNNGTNVSAYSPSGIYSLYDSNPTNTYAVSYALQPDFAPYYSSGTTNYNNISIPVASGPQVLYFPVTVTQTYNEVSIAIASYNPPPRPGLTYANTIIYKNLGIAPANGTITFVKPPQINTYTVNQTGTTANATGFTYAFTNLLPNETRGFNVIMTVPLVPIVNMNDVLTNSATIATTGIDINMANNSYSNSQIVVNSYDPNDKMESRGKTIPFNTFAPDDYFFYTIRFQNNGTADAIDVRIEDVLNSQIDPNSVLMVGSSHNYTMRRTNNQLVWDFKNIFLTPSGTNESGSKGYVQFKVRLNPGFQAGDIIPNNASIYFDSNPAIVTATFNSKFTVPLGVGELDADSLALYPNPADNIIHISLSNTAEIIETITIYDLLGKKVNYISSVASHQATVDVSQMSNGIYLVEIKTQNNVKQTKKLIIQ